MDQTSSHIRKTIVMVLSTKAIVNNKHFCLQYYEVNKHHYWALTFQYSVTFLSVGVSGGFYS